MSDTKMVPGGWTRFHELSPQDRKLFNSVKKPLGVDYHPLQVMTQVVAGVNYRFWCDTHTVTPNPVYGAAVVDIFAPLEGKPQLGPITPIK